MTTVDALSASRTERDASASVRTGQHSARSAVLDRDGWAVLVLGTVARSYLVLIVSLTLIAGLPLAFGWIGSVVQSGSMRPAITAGDVVLSTPLPASEPMPLGSVVQFSAPAAGGGEHQVVHRIVAPGDQQGEWITRGDANAEQDSTALTREKVTGQGRLLVRWVGLPGFWLSTGNTAALALWLSVTLAAVALAVWSWPGDERERPPARDRSTVTWRKPVVLTVAVLAAGTMAIGPEHASAAFTASTSTPANTFRVGSWSVLSLGRASTYAILAATRISNADSHSTILGSIAVSPGTSLSGIKAAEVTGSIDLNTPGAVNARTDALALQRAIAARPTTGPAPASLTGRLTPGTWRTATPVQVDGTLTLDAGGDPSAVFVVSAAALTFGQGASVVLTNGASPDKVFFVSESTTVVSGGATLRGVLLAQSDVRVDRGTTLTGRIVSLHGAVDLKNATVAQP